MNEPEPFVVKLPVNKRLLWNVFVCLIKSRLLVLSLPRNYIEQRVFSEGNRHLRRASRR